jgi:hypothetical protein
MASRINKEYAEITKKEAIKMKDEGSSAMEYLATYFWAILTAIVVIVVLAIWFNNNPDKINDYQNCLKDIAIKECEARGLNYSSMDLTFKPRVFDCVIKDNRSLLEVPFKFYDEELEGCKSN